MSMRGAVAGCVVLVCLVALLAERTEGHITFFSPKEMMLMKEREGKRPETRQLGDVSSPKPPTVPPTSPGEQFEFAVVSLPDDGDQAASEFEEFLHGLPKKHYRAK